MIYVAVVSHGHADIIKNINTISLLAKHPELHVVVKDNLGEFSLSEFCDANGIGYLSDGKGMGFGANNNYIFERLPYHIRDEDYFVVLNPDVSVDADVILAAASEMQARKSRLATINLYRDAAFSKFDNSIRFFPTFFDFCASYIGLKNKTVIDKSKISVPVHVDWSAGSFLMFRVDLYRKLHGFNEKYFMYCEDIDICWRAKVVEAERVLYLPNCVAVHQAKFSNRCFLSKHFFWHVSSVFRFLSYRYGLIKLYNKE